MSTHTGLVSPVVMETIQDGRLRSVAEHVIQPDVSGSGSGAVSALFITRSHDAVEADKYKECVIVVKDIRLLR